MKTGGGAKLSSFSQGIECVSPWPGRGMGPVPTHTAERMPLLEPRMQPTLHSHGLQVCAWEKPTHQRPTVPHSTRLTPCPRSSQSPSSCDPCMWVYEGSPDSTGRPALVPPSRSPPISTPPPLLPGPLPFPKSKCHALGAGSSRPQDGTGTQSLKDPRGRKLRLVVWEERPMASACTFRLKSFQNIKHSFFP